MPRAKRKAIAPELYEDEPIRRVERTGGKVAYKVVLDVSGPGATKRKQLQRTFFEADSKEALTKARRWIADTRAELLGGEFVTPQNETLNSIARRWLASRVDVKPVTLEFYENNLAAVLRRLGDRKVQSLTRADMRALVSWLATSGGKASKTHPQGRPLSPRSVRAAMVALGQVLDLAVEDELVKRNVSRGIKRPKIEQKKGGDLEHWSPAQFAIFREHADTTDLAAAWRLTAAGLTRADVLGLRWSDVDLDTGTVTVRQGRVPLQNGGQRSHISEPKSEQRRRTIPVEEMYPGTTALLRAYKVRQAADKLKAGPGYAESGLLVVDAIGTPVRPEWYSDHFRSLCREARVPSIRLHSVRHSLAFWLHSLGVTPGDAAALLGHTVEVHLATYLPESGATGIGAAATALRRATAGE